MSEQNEQTQPKQARRWWNDWTLFAYHFGRSNYVTAAWNWFMGLAGKAAEPFLFVSVLYSGYKLLPGVPQPGAGLDAGVFIAQQATLDIGGMSLMKLAQQANQSKGSFPYVVGFILVALMIANVIVASLERLVPLGNAGVVIEGILLVARAVMAVLYGHAIHSLRSDDDHEPEGVVKSSDVHSRLDSYSASLQNQQGQIDRLSSKVDTLTRNVTPLSTQLHALRQSLDALTTTLSSFETRLALIDTRLTTVEQGQESSFTELQTNLHTIIAGVREAMVRELIRELSPLIEQTGNSSARASLPTPSGRSASTSGRQETVKQPADPQKTKWVRTGDTRKPNTPGNEGGRVDTQERDSINSRKIINLSTGNGGDSRSRQSQAEVIAYILDFFHRERREPTLSEIINTTGCAKQTAVNSRNSARETFQQEKECMASASQL